MPEKEKRERIYINDCRNLTADLFATVAVSGREEIFEAAAVPPAGPVIPGDISGAPGRICSTRQTSAPDLRFDLQLFADDSPTGQKTEEATPHRRQEARKQGQVGKSADLIGMLVLLASFGVIYFSGKFIVDEMIRYTATQYGQLRWALDEQAMSKMIINFITTILMVVGPIALGAVVATLAAGFYQVGFEFTLEPMELNLGRLNPMNGLQKMISPETLFELAKSIIKVLSVVYIPYYYFTNNLHQFPKFIALEPRQVLEKAGPMAFDLAIKVLIVMLVLAVIDYYYQNYQFEKSIMMSRYDIQQEMKMQEGNPQIKQEMRRRARKIAMAKMMSEVPKAQVVVTNPTHFAVALAYDSENGGAPVVLAKGADAIAQRIRQIATDNNIPIYEDRPLARALYDQAEVGDEIPAELYEGVAKILAFVYKQSGRSAA